MVFLLTYEISPERPELNGTMEDCLVKSLNVNSAAKTRVLINRQNVGGYAWALGLLELGSEKSHRSEGVHGTVYSLRKYKIWPHKVDGYRVQDCKYNLWRHKYR